MVDIRGIDDEQARETLREALDRGVVSGVRFTHSSGCDPLWDDLTDLPVFDRELKQGGVQMVWARVCMAPLTFLRLQAASSEAAGGDRAQSETARAEQFLAEPLMGESPRLKEMIRLLEAGKRDLPLPFIELDREGRLRGFQEGRTRSMAAFYADVGQMPALVFLNTRKTNGVARLDPPSEFTLEAILEREEPAGLSGDGDFAAEIRRRMDGAGNTIWLETVISQSQSARAGDISDISDFIEEQAGTWAESMPRRPDIERVFCVRGTERPEPRQPFGVPAGNRVHCFIALDTDEMTTRMVDGLRKGITRRFRGEDVLQDEPPEVASFRGFEEVNVVSEDVIAAVAPELTGPPREDVEFIE